MQVRYWVDVNNYKNCTGNNSLYFFQNVNIESIYVYLV